MIACCDGNDVASSSRRAKGVENIGMSCQDLIEFQNRFGFGTPIFRGAELVSTGGHLRKFQKVAVDQQLVFSCLSVGVSCQAVDEPAQLCGVVDMVVVGIVFPTSHVQ